MKRVKNYIKFIFSALFIISYIIDLFSFSNNFQMLNNVNITNDIYIEIFMLLFITLIINIIKFFFLIVIYISIKFAYKSFYKEYLSINDFNNYKNYFRDIIKTYNPSILSYIDDYKIDLKKDIISELLYLKETNIIKLDEVNNKIIVNNNINKKLNSLEEYIINLIRNNKLNSINEYTYINLIQKEAINYKLLKENKGKINIGKLFLKIFIFFIMFIFSIIFMVNIANNDNIYTIILILIIGSISIILMSLLMFGLPIYIIAYIFVRFKHPFKRTDKGEEINIRLEGLKNFLRDFSSLDEKSTEDIVIWDEYLIYSVLFNQNKSIINEVYNKYFSNI